MKVYNDILGATRNYCSRWKKSKIIAGSVIAPNFVQKVGVNVRLRLSEAAKRNDGLNIGYDDIFDPIIVGCIIYGEPGKMKETNIAYQIARNEGSQTKIIHVKDIINSEGLVKNITAYEKHRGSMAD